MDTAGSTTGSMGSTGMGSETASTETTPLTDDQIAKITSTVSEGEVEQAKVARQKAKDQRVKTFARHMIDQHTQAKQKTDKLAKKAEMKPADSTVSTDLDTRATQTLEQLKTAQATDFDKTYIEAQVTQHQEVLDLLNSKLIPAAQNADLKAQLEEQRTMVEEHLTQARQISESLANTTGPTSATQKPQRPQTSAALTP